MDKTLGNKIKQLRKERKLTQKEFSDLINTEYNLHTDRPMISKWEIGFQTPQISTLKCIASFFGVSLDYINSMDSPKGEYSSLILTPIEEEYVKKMREISDSNKDMVYNLIDDMYEGRELEFEDEEIENKEAK